LKGLDRNTCQNIECLNKHSSHQPRSKIQIVVKSHDHSASRQRNEEISLLGLEHRDDATVKMLYAIAKEYLDHEIHNEEKTVEVLLNI
jgi:hypothetical protein